MRNVFTVFQREYLQRVRTRAFVIGTIAAPLLMIAFVVVPVVLEARGDAEPLRVAIVDRTGVLADRLSERLRDAAYEVEVADPDSPVETSVRDRAESGDLTGVIELDEQTLARGEARWISDSPPSAIRRFVIEEAVTRSALEARLGVAATESEVADLLAGGSLEYVSVRDDAEIDSESRRTGTAAGFVGGILLYIVLIGYGSTVARAVLEEKSGRIVEIIISSIRPWELLLGKIVGLGAVGFTQIAVWIGSGFLLAAVGVPAMIPFIADSGALDQLSGFLPGPGVVLFFLICFVLGFFLYASLFAAVGAVCSTEQETHQFQLPIVMMLVAAFFLMMPIMEDPDTTFGTVVSLIPFFSPIVMFARVAAGSAAAWEAGLSVILMAGGVFACAWIVGRIYRVGILMQGKRATLPEIWRWVREA